MCMVSKVRDIIIITKEAKQEMEMNEIYDYFLKKWGHNNQIRYKKMRKEN